MLKLFVLALAALSGSVHAAQTVFIGGCRPDGTTPYTVDTATGAATLFGDPVGMIEGMSFDTTRGRILATIRSSNQIKTIDPVTGAVGNLSASVPITLDGLAYDSTRDLFWASDQSNARLYTINPVTGTATLATPVPLGGGNVRPGGLGYDPVADVLYGVDDDRLYRINTTTFATTAVGPAGLGVGFNDVDAVEFDTQTGLLYIVNDLGGGSTSVLQRFASLDPATGLATVIGSTGLQEQFGQGMAIIAPEPASLSIALAGAFMRRRR